MDHLIVYPRGYTTGYGKADNRIASSGDEVIDALFECLTSERGASRSWPLHAQVMKAALVHFGDFHEWLDTQLSNPQLSSKQKDYLLDTVSFLSGNHRTMSQYSWMFVLEEVETDLSKLRIQRLNQSTGVLKKGLTTIQVLQRWCRQPEGILDLLTTLYVLFGRVGRTTA